MLIIHGIRHLNQRRIAGRKDYCNCCEREVLTEQLESHDFLHIFFIPLIPLGTRQRWRCLECGRNPRARTQARWVNILGTFILFLVVFAVWVAPLLTEDRPDEMGPGMIWFMRIALSFALIAAVYFNFFRKPVDVNQQNEIKRNAVKPLDATTCPFCHSRLQTGPVLRCPVCHVRLYTRV